MGKCQKVEKKKFQEQQNKWVKECKNDQEATKMDENREISLKFYLKKQKLFQKQSKIWAKG